VLASRVRDVVVEDHLERRIRKPVDLLRCMLSCIEVTALALIGVAARATANGVETDILGASNRLPHSLLKAAPPLALLALALLPVALAVSLLIHRQPRRLAEAAATGILAVAATVAADAVLRHSAFTVLYDALVVHRSGAGHMTALDGYLAGLAAYTTMIGLSGRPRWRNALWLIVGSYALVQLTALHTTVLALLITLSAGRAIGLGVRYAAGSMSQRPSAAEIAAALTPASLAPATLAPASRSPASRSPASVAPADVGANLRVTGMRRVAKTGSESRRYLATTYGEGTLDIAVYDRDHEAAGALYRMYRALLLRNQVPGSAPLSVDRTVEHRALLSYAAEEAGGATPRLRAVVRVGAQATALAYEHHEGKTLAERDSAHSAVVLGRIWDAVLQLHAHQVTHRTLTADHILVTPDDEVMLLDPGGGDLAASDLQLHLDLAQLIAELALLVGPQASASLALEKTSAVELLAVVPLLQPAALCRSTRTAVRHRKDVLTALRKLLLAAVPGGEVTPVRLERVRPRTLVTLIASIVAVYLLAAQLAKASLESVLHTADWRWSLPALGLSALTYVGATWEFSGYVTERLQFTRTLLVQLAGSFVTLVTPAAVGGAALNLRYLQRRKIPAPLAAASVGVSQVVAFVLHILLLVVFATLAGTIGRRSYTPPRSVYFVLAGLVAIALAVLAVPAGRRLARARVAPVFGQVLPRLAEVAQQPRKLTEGIGGALLLSASYIACLEACVRAFGGSVSLAGVAVVYLAGSSLGSIIPTPGGLGAVEAVLTAGLTTAGMHGAAAASAVLLFRLLTFWLPVPAGWAALNYLERRDVL
jgi:glycosyltransferase 2 family protein